MKKFVIGDIHGAHMALKQCLERSKFNIKDDKLIVLGDVCDGWPFVKDCFDELLKIKHMTYVMGNHDLWALEWALNANKEEIWLSQGGRNTILSYPEGSMKTEHVDILKNAKYYVEDDERLFVHGGFHPLKDIKDQSPSILVWDRSLIEQASIVHFDNPDFRFEPYKEIFLGHTPTLRFNVTTPVQFCNVWGLDTGAGWGGKLTIMDIETKEFWQSDSVQTLYPNIHGRTN